MGLKKLSSTQRVMSIIIGMIAGIWVGWVVNITLKNYDKTFAYSLPILIIIGAILIGLLAFKFPRTTEIFIAGFVVSLIVIGAVWDLIIDDWSMLRAMILLSGLGIIILDVLLGSITYKDITKIGKRLAGGKG